MVPGFAAYSASKFALEALADVYRYELSQLGIDSVIASESKAYSMQRMLRLTRQVPKDDSYLGEHRNDPGRGCPVGALAGDVARSDKRTRALATKLISESFEWLANFIRETSENDKCAARARAIMTYCALVGAITMARAVSDEQLSREILMTLAQLLKNPAPKAALRHPGR